MTDLPKMDIRVRHRYVQKGALARDAVRKHDDDLQDTMAQADWVDYEQLFEQDKAEQAAAAAVAVPKDDGPPDSIIASTPLATTQPGISSTLIGAPEEEPGPAVTSSPSLAQRSPHATTLIGGDPDEIED